MTIPMTPFLLLQILLRATTVKYTLILTTLSIGCISTSALLTYLLPTVKLNTQKGNYDVGAVDLFLPMEDEIKMNNSDDNLPLNDYVNVRILYPTNKKVSSSTRSLRSKLKSRIKRILTKNYSKIPYIDHDISKQYLSQIIKLAPIPVLKMFTWMLYPWRLISLPISKERLVNEDSKKLPIVIFSHGLFGSCHLYSYQGYHLASEGKCVIMVNHLDGSAPIAKRDDFGLSSSLVLLDTDIFNLYREKKIDEYTDLRRKQTNFRSDEILSALISILRVNQGEIISNKINFLQNKLDRDNITLIGHSFGGASVISAATKYPELVKNVIVQDPATDWMDEPIRRSLLSESRLLNSDVTYDGGSTGWKKKNETQDRGIGEEKKESELLRRLSSSSLNSWNGKSIHDVNLFFIYCEEWYEKGWGTSKILKQMHTKGQLGSSNTQFDVLKDSKHQHFSDVNVITPNWLNKKLGLTGDRCSYCVLDEVMDKMLCFMDL